MSGGINHSSVWPHIEEFIEFGRTVNLGRITPFARASVAADAQAMLVALVRRKAETFSELMTRLDKALDQDINQEGPTDEINS